jgi:signal peptidase II
LKKEIGDKVVKALPRVPIIFTIVLILDGLTKTWTIQALKPYQSVPIMGDFFRLTLGYNTGVAFSMFTNSGAWLLILTGIIIVGLGVWSINALRIGELPLQAAWSVGLILGGAIGNFVDRLLDGRVTDFLDFGLGTLRWPAFNLADSCIVVGIIWLMLMKMKTGPDAGDTSEKAPNPSEELEVIE